MTRRVAECGYSNAWQFFLASVLPVLALLAVLAVRFVLLVALTLADVDRVALCLKNDHDRLGLALTADSLLALACTPFIGLS